MTDRIGSLSEAPAPSAETVVLRNEYNQEVIDSLAGLHPRDQELVALIVWDDIAIDEDPCAQRSSFLQRGFATVPWVGMMVRVRSPGSLRLVVLRRSPGAPELATRDSRLATCDLRLASCVLRLVTFLSPPLG